MDHLKAISAEPSADAQNRSNTIEQTRPIDKIGSVGPAEGLEFRKLDVNIRDTEYIAGRRNVTAVVIRNTYQRQITLLSVTARHSTLNSQDSQQTFRASIRKRRPSNTRVSVRLYNWLPAWLPFWGKPNARRSPVFELHHRFGSVTESDPLHITAQKGSTVNLDKSDDLGREIYIDAEEGSTIGISESQKGRPQSHELQISPSSEVVSEYVWRTSHAILFIPSRIGIDIEIRYSINDEERSQVISSFFDIKPPIQALVLGGISGGVIGNLARSFTDTDLPSLDTRFFVKLVGSCLLSVMAVITLSRKSGSQAFITVEDFFGAFVLGSLIGYEGTTFFDKSVIDPKAATPLAPHPG